jgi:predicted DNA-binding WGR domain protein
VSAGQEQNRVFTVEAAATVALERRLKNKVRRGYAATRHAASEETSALPLGRG